MNYVHIIYIYLYVVLLILFIYLLHTIVSYVNKNSFWKIIFWLISISTHGMFFAHYFLGFIGMPHTIPCLTGDASIFYCTIFDYFYSVLLISLCLFTYYFIVFKRWIIARCLFRTSFFLFRGIGWIFFIFYDSLLPQPSKSEQIDEKMWAFKTLRARLKIPKQK